MPFSLVYTTANEGTSKCIGVFYFILHCWRVYFMVYMFFLWPHLSRKLCAVHVLTCQLCNDTLTHIMVLFFVYVFLSLFVWRFFIKLEINSNAEHYDPNKITSQKRYWTFVMASLHFLWLKVILLFMSNQQQRIDKKSTVLQTLSPFSLSLSVKMFFLCNNVKYFLQIQNVHVYFIPIKIQIFLEKNNKQTKKMCLKNLKRMMQFIFTPWKGSARDWWYTNPTNGKSIVFGRLEQSGRFSIPLLFG